MKTAILCNSRLAILAIQQLVGTNQLLGCAIPDKLHDENEDITYTCRQLQVPIRSFSRQQVENEMSSWIAEMNPDVVLVLTFPYIIPEKLLSQPLYGFINFHFGLLPAYRGADPIFWQLKNRETMGGISMHRMTTGLDKGPLYAIQQVPIHPQDTYGSHSNALALAATEVALRLLSSLAERVQPISQNEKQAHYYKRPALEDTLIDWTKPASEIIALVNACNPWNKGALTLLNGYPMKIISTVRAETTSSQTSPGVIIHADSTNGLTVSCGQNEQLHINICYFNNEFVGPGKLAITGLYPGLQFDLPKKILHRKDQATNIV